jgi:hypothetical protein
VAGLAFRLPLRMTSRTARANTTAGGKVSAAAIYEEADRNARATSRLARHSLGPDGRWIFTVRRSDNTQMAHISWMAPESLGIPSLLATSRGKAMSHMDLVLRKLPRIPVPVVH